MSFKWIEWIAFVVWLTNESHLHLIFSRDHCQRLSTSQFFDTPQAGFEPAQNLSWDYVEWICAGVMTTTPRHQKMSFLKLYKNSSISHKLFNFCFLLALTKYKLLRCWSYSWKILIESLKSIKKPSEKTNFVIIKF